MKITICCRRVAQVLMAGALCSSTMWAAEQEAKLREALTFYAPFDGGADAQFAAGDSKLYHAPAMNKRGEAQTGLPPDAPTVLARNQGKFGDALRFKEKKAPLVFFHADKNVAYQERDWNGTVSLWLSTDPENDLAPGFCDPIQITPRAWNDAAFFVEFEKPKADTLKGGHQTIPFRLGVYSDFKVWNPQNRKWEEIPFNEKPLVTVEKPPFTSGKWTHIVFTFENFNTGKSNGVAKLYLDGKFQGQISPREQTFTWDPAKSAIMLGLSYVGLFDELSLFKRALSDKEIATLYSLPQGVKTLLN